MSVMKKAENQKEKRKGPVYEYMPIKASVLMSHLSLLKFDATEEVFECH